MTVPEALAILAAGIGAGTINTVVGSGTLLTFPVLLGLGHAPVVANVSSTIGLVPGSVSGAWGYRRELAGQRQRVRRLGAWSLIGGTTGAALLLILPASAFKAIVPAFILLALVMILLQPRLSAALASAAGSHRRERGLVAPALVGLSGVYGGYFGAAQGILLFAILGLTLDDDLQRINALKNVLGGLVNGVAAVIFILVAEVAWGPVALLAAGSILGGQVGARYGRRIPAEALRGLIVAVGLAAIMRLLTG